jgi:uncharacterized protein with HEPN domain
MSDRATELLLLDILDSIDKIQSYIECTDFDHFKNNSMLRDAVERNVEIIGEAANKISKKFKEQHPDIEWYKPIAMRNRLIHGYFAIDIPMLWNTVTKVLPPFRISIEQLLRSND